MGNKHNKRNKRSRKQPFATLRTTRKIATFREKNAYTETAVLGTAYDDSTTVTQTDDSRSKIAENEPSIGASTEFPNILDNAEVSDDDALTVESIPVDQGRVCDTQIEGRRIVDINFFLQQLHEKFDDHKIASRCRFNDIRMFKFVDRGLRTQLHFDCQSCDYKFSVWTDPESEKMGIDESAVCGSITSGIGYSTLQEQLAAMSIPVMSEKTYIKHRESLYNTFNEVVTAETKRAASLEREIAIEKGNVINGIPYIDVVADGCWAKRSYAGGRHDALSGAAMIFGRETKLALFVGVRNKYCVAHARAELKSIEPSRHLCCKNWGRDVSSNAMETDIIVEGFRTSVECNGLIYKTIISDGDSSVYQAIRDHHPYDEYGVIVEKLECNNHLFRNCCRKLRSASTMKLTSTPLKDVLNVTQFRQYVASSGYKIRQCVEEARDLRNAEDIPESVRVTKLCEDILNIAPHVFGDHTNCKSLPFACDPQEYPKNVFAELHRTGLHADVYEAVRYLSSHARSLLKNVNNNVAEGCNSIVNKLNSGKRINHCLKDSYEMRCYGAVVQSNTQSVLSKIQLHRNNRVSTAVAKMEKTRQRRNELTRLYKSEKRSRRRRKFHGCDKDYGPSAQKPDIDDDVFVVMAERHMNKLKSHQANSRQIERDTVTQSDSELWHQLRTEILTASKFGPICRMLPTTSCASMVASIRYPKIVDTAATQFGLANENNARQDVASKLGKEIVPCGLFIDQEVPYLGASPDGLIDDDGIVELKCPFSAQIGEMEEVIYTNSNLRSIFDRKDKNSMNKNHAYFYQVQGQLHITRREYCIFALWNSTSMKLVKVLRDDAFWASKMKPFLCRFYTECLLPEIIDSRRSRNMRIRDPEYILNAQKEALQRKIDRDGRKPHEANDCTKSTVSVPLPIVDKKTAVVNTKDTACLGVSRNAKDIAAADWIDIESDEDVEHSEHTVGLLEIVRRNITVEEVAANVLSPCSLLTDSSIDLFQNILQENSSFVCNPASYTAYHSCIKPCNPLRRDLQIIGGNSSRHWCCVYYDAQTLYVYDSLVPSEYELLGREQKRYISKRYPYFNVGDVILQPVTRQPDSFSCGVYAAAYATTVALGLDPVRQAYSRDAKLMREHLMVILETRNLTSFPSE